MVDYILNPDSQDAYVWATDSSNEGNTNYGYRDVIIVQGTGIGTEILGLIQFDLTGHDTTFTQAILRLNMYQSDTTHTTDIYIRRVTSSWSEGTVTYNTKPSATTTNQVTYTSLNDAGLIYIDITQLIKDIINNTNYGLMLVNSSGTSYTTRNVTSRDHYSWQDPNADPQLTLTYTGYNDIYVNSSTGSNSNVGDSCTSGHPVQTFAKAYQILNSGGTIHVCNSGADFSAETVSLNKSFSIDLNSASGNFYMCKAG